MSALNILVYCPDNDTLANMLRIIAIESAWDAKGTTSDEEAIDLFQYRGYDLVILSGLTDVKIEAKLKAMFTRLNKQINILIYAGGDDWFLTAQINTIMGMSNENMLVKDNPFG